MSYLEVTWPPGPILTKRLILRGSKVGDRSAYIDLFSNPQVWTYLGGARDRDDLEEAVPPVPGNHPGIFVVEVAGELAGTVVLDRRDRDRPGHIRDQGEELEVSYTFLPAYWGRGFAAEAVEAVLSWAGAELADGDILLCTQTANQPSMLLAKRLGFIEVGSFEEFGSQQWLGRRPV